MDGKPITRDELIERCLEKYGAKELKTLVAMATLRQACERHGITVTDEEVEAEAARVAAKFGLPLEDWYRTLSKERDLPKDVYLNDVLRPGVMFKKLERRAGHQRSRTSCERPMSRSSSRIPAAMGGATKRPRRPPDPRTSASATWSASSSRRSRPWRA